VLLARVLLLKLKILELVRPIVSLVVQPANEVQKFGIAIAVIKPYEGQGLVLPAPYGPLFQRIAVELGGLVGEVAFHQWDNPRVGGRLLVLREGLQHHKLRPPVGIVHRTDRAIRALIGQRPVEPLSGACDEDRIIEQIRQRNQTVEIVRPALPTLTRAAQPSTFRPELLPDFLNMSGEAVSLDLKLPFKPAPWPHGGEGQEPVRSGSQRGPVFHAG